MSQLLKALVVLALLCASAALGFLVRSRMPGTPKVEGVDRVYRADDCLTRHNSGRRARVADNLREERLRHRRT